MPSFFVMIIPGMPLHAFLSFYSLILNDFCILCDFFHSIFQSPAARRCWTRGLIQLPDDSVRIHADKYIFMGRDYSPLTFVNTGTVEPPCHRRSRRFCGTERAD